MRVTVVGASGEFGSVLSRVLEGRGVDVVRAHRATGVDAVTGDGLTEACEGSDVIVDATSLMSRSADESVAFFSAVARNISTAADATGARVVYLGIYGASDPVVNKKMGHYRGKAEQAVVYEQMLGDDATALLSTQWYSLPEKFMSQTTFGPIAVAPHMHSRPAAVEDVAEAMADVVLDPARPSRVTVAGPAEMDLADVAKAVAAHRGSPRWVLGVNYGGAGLRSGGLVPADPDVTTSTTFEQWLAGR
ncbi:SDR family oxidoreductase [Gordonia neofelifaecis]|uniref:NmrA family protein n=1 Tax=Gordonia neofelifaecis NRRL B-59395 TaxID=644548 RepID=F1YFF4_9ACTN|nr:NmrA family transcriptional regulator [Gordonia neofelifaecis]EGD56442.1 NmrA family protein [Gordonia neofelifaecis NRRL B-59395]